MQQQACRTPCHRLQQTWPYTGPEGLPTHTRHASGSENFDHRRQAGNPQRLAKNAAQSFRRGLLLGNTTHASNGPSSPVIWGLLHSRTHNVHQCAPYAQTLAASKRLLAPSHASRTTFPHRVRRSLDASRLRSSSSSNHAKDSQSSAVYCLLPGVVQRRKASPRSSHPVAPALYKRAVPARFLPSPRTLAPTYHSLPP